MAGTTIPGTVRTGAIRTGRPDLIIPTGDGAVIIAAITVGTMAVITAACTAATMAAIMPPIRIQTGPTAEKVAHRLRTTAHILPATDRRSTIVVAVPQLGRAPQRAYVLQPQQAAAQFRRGRG